MDIIMYVLLGILILSFVGLVIWLIYEFTIAIYQRTLRYETFPSTAKVCNKKYKEEYTTTTIKMVGKVMVPQTNHHDKEYNVYLMYVGGQYCFDDEDLYNSVNVGDIVRVLVHEGYNEKNELKHVYLSNVYLSSEE